MLNDLDDIPVVSNNQEKPSRCEWGLSKMMEKQIGNSTNREGNDDSSEGNDEDIYENQIELSLSENFLAPEQVMTDNQWFEFYINEKVRYDTEKIDIWKVPDMVMFILTKSVTNLSTSVDVTRVLLSVEDILKQCKSINRNDRPNAEELIEKFKGILNAIKQNFNHNNQDHMNLPELTNVNKEDNNILVSRILGVSA